MKKETNLEHYKKELTEIFIANCYNQQFIAKRIANRLDKNMKCSDQASYMEGILDWMAQPYRRPILDGVEKEYLRAVIKPFRNRIKYISLGVYIEDYYRIIIVLNSAINTRVLPTPLFLPPFKKGAMYKGMKARKDYTLEELGL